MKMFEDAVTASGYAHQGHGGMPFISSQAWSDYTQEHGEYATDTARRSTLSRAKKSLIEQKIIREVKGGYCATQDSMSGVFAGAFLGLQSFG